MSDHGGHYRLRIEGVGEEALHRDPTELDTPAGREPEVRALSQSADDRAAGVHRFDGNQWR